LDIVRNSKVEIKPSIDNHIQSFSFEKEHAFFKWSSHKYPFEVKQLLSGEKTTLYADIKDAKFDAIKFCTLYLLIEIKSTNSTLNEKSRKFFENFFVELKHSGVSYYKYKQDTFIINMNYDSGEKLLLRYKYGSTSIENTNESYRKLAENKPVLSPYTFWEIKLDPISPKDKINLFDGILPIFKGADEIIISLNGKGQYVTESMKRNYQTTNSGCMFDDNYEKVRKLIE
jgi:hypothetical protein